MSFHTDWTLGFLGSATAVMTSGTAASTIFTTPLGKVTRISAVLIRDPTGSLAGGTDYDFTSWRQTVDLSGMTGGAADYRWLFATDNTSFTELAAGTNFQVTKSTGSSAAVTATIDVFGTTTS